MDLPRDHSRPRTEAAERIFRVAQRQFAERGYDAVSMQDIARDASVSKANVFHHFISKNDLYRLILDDSAREFQQLLDLLRPDGRPLEQLLAEFAGAHLQRLFEQPEAATLILRQLLNTQGVDDAREFTENLLAESFDRVCEAFATLQRSAQIHADADPRVLAQVLLSSQLMFFVFRSAVQRTRHGRDLTDPAVYSRRLLDIVLYGVQPTGTSTHR